ERESSRAKDGNAAATKRQAATHNLEKDVDNLGFNNVVFTDPGQLAYEQRATYLDWYSLLRVQCAVTSIR
ncbi:hypothetical protein LCGC14_2427310, partial [marine sediment metagenome]